MESGAIKRRLTAILAADAVNYSRHMGEDEEGTLRQLAAHRAVIDRIIEAHEGRIVGTAGDSVLAEFASPVQAVRCAVEIQRGMIDRLHRRVSLPNPRCTPTRHLGNRGLGDDEKVVSFRPAHHG